MKIVADFHIHSPYSRAVSKEMTLENLDSWAGIKGITVMGTGDFTHPKWMQEIKAKLEPAEEGLFALRGHPASKTRFILTVEISSIYSKGGKVRRIHNLFFFPSIESVEKFNAVLGWQGNLKSDGRPIVGVGAKELAKIAFDADPRAVVIPAHAWTPWFSVFGSMSGFNSLEECFDEYASHIFAIETGLSSDPAMNWRLSALDRISFISNSDSHSLQRIGREANVFDLSSLSYDMLAGAIKRKDPKEFLFTVEFFPEEGKYHYDGHRACGVRFGPEETKKVKKMCPKCGKPLTVGVMYRVDELADRPAGITPDGRIPFKSLVPLDEIIAESLDLGTSSKRVKAEYKKSVESFGSEFSVLMDTSDSDLKNALLPEIAEGIRRVRAGELHIEPGYDGEYGVVKIFNNNERKMITAQTALF
ncbi:MAG: DNA helicase UvrD [Candidatus Sungbacteria bacterium RIFCSPHIGHO2_01_FULL_50_25]|uniref:DNA helicase UvrD n=1 Tax=Candidatus Sungbacteria bacterium RIFCSPHIGHO2_01_FULL_50_25 TaxID=1802265 RepID=A0A1G2K8U3_9BACT|nr:MAG: DNA helicase UvrD [Candidatus Sungbacteria bacterium RIFCSPHIGHO2_01_FULL_50_25]